jgi:hypothetical protein
LATPELDYKKTGDCAAYLESFRETLKKDDWLRCREKNKGEEVKMLDPTDPANAPTVEEVFGRMHL